MIEGLMTVVKASASRVVSGGNLITTPAVREERLKICKECPEQSGNTCKKCGCFIAGKVAAAASYCPVKKWNAEEIK